MPDLNLDAQAPKETADLARELDRAEEAIRDQRYAEASGICHGILSRHPDCAQALAILGDLLFKQGDVQGAVGFVERAAALDVGNLRYQHLLCGAYRLLYRSDKELGALRRALALNPSSLRLNYDLGTCLMDCGEWEAAISAFLTCLAADPQNAAAHLAIGQILLGRGEMRPGWIEYQWRNKIATATTAAPPMVAPAWNGMAMPDRCLLVIGDEGFGDIFQFSRYIPQAAQICGEVVLACAPELKRLLKGIRGLSRAEDHWDRLPPHACHVLLSNLPMLLGAELYNIPEPSFGIVADTPDVARWSLILAEHAPPESLKVGLVWRGRDTHGNDWRRSVRLTDVGPLSQVEGVTFFSLQKPGPRHDDPAAFPGLIDLSDKLSDFYETAGALMNLDLLITVDTAVAHLAGTLGVKTFLMTPKPADWRWLHDRADSPWYPSLQLFRQKAPGAWDSVVSDIHVALALFARR